MFRQLRGFLESFSYRHKPWGKCGENGLVILGENVGEFLGENKHKKKRGEIHHHAL